jgi:hypothetical protein
MFRTRIMRNFTTVSLLVLFVFTSALWAQSSKGDQLLKMVPAKAIFYVQINNFDNAMNQMDQFLAGASPMPMGVSMLARGQLINLLGSPQLNGLNTSGNFAIFGAAMSGGSEQSKPVPEMFVGILAPVTDYKQLIDGNPNCTEPDEKGVSKITKDGAPILLVTKTGADYALLSWANDYDKLVAVAKEISTADAKGLAGTLNAAETKQAMTEPIWAYSNIQQVSKTYGPLVTEKINEMKTMMKSLQESGQEGPFGNMQNILNMYILVIDTLLKETQSLNVAINPKPNVLKITKTINAVPDTKMASMFVSDASSQKQNALLGYMEDGAIMNYGCSMSAPFIKQLQTCSIDIFTAMGGETISDEQVAKMKTLTDSVLKCIEGPVVYSVLADPNSKPPFVVKYVVALKDPEKFNPLIEEAMEMMTTSGIMDFYKSLGMESSFEVKRGIDSYKGVSIDSAKLSMKSTQVGTPQAQMVTAMYGDGFDYRWGIAKDLFVCAAGGDVDSNIRELIDQAQAGSSKQIGSETKAAIALLPGADKADFLLTFNLIRVFTMATAFMPIPMPKMNVPTKSNIVVAGKAGDGKMVVDIAVPKEHLSEIMGAFLMMQQQQMQQQMQQQQMK